MDNSKTRVPIFLDTEFTGLNQHSTLISLALVKDENAFFYAEFTDYDTAQVSPWLQENVLANLKFEKRFSFIESHDGCTCMKGTRDEVRKALEGWFIQVSEVEIWADVLAFDWVLFCNIFDDAFQIPQNIFYIPFDMATALKISGFNPDISRKELAFSTEEEKNIVLEKYGSFAQNQHNALFDAVVLREVYHKVIKT